MTPGRDAVRVADPDSEMIQVRILAPGSLTLVLLLFTGNQTPSTLCIREPDRDQYDCLAADAYPDPFSFSDPESFSVSDTESDSVPAPDIKQDVFCTITIKFFRI
jgi:hypothetical protein